MNFKQLRVFAAVARHQHITKASQALRVSQPSISRHLKSLEAAYKVKLYRARSAGGIELTEEGQLFLDHANSVLLYLEKLEEIFHPDRRPASSDLTVAGNYSASATLLPAALRLFKETRPMATITLKTATSKEVQQMLLRSEIDIGIVKNWDMSPSIAAEPYRYEKVIAFISKNHPLAKAKNLSLSDITAMPFIVVGWRKGKGSVEQQILKDFARKGNKVKIAMICESPVAVKAAVQLKMGVGLSFEDCVRPDIRNGDFKEVKLPGVSKMGAVSSIIWHSKRPLSPNALHFRQLLIEMCRKRRHSDSNLKQRGRTLIEWAQGAG